MLWLYDLMLFLSQLVPGVIFCLACWLIAYGIMLAFEQRAQDPPLEFEQPVTEQERAEDLEQIRKQLRAVLLKYEFNTARRETSNEGENAQ